MIDLPVDHGSLAHILPVSWKTQIAAWLAEDTPSFDVGGFVVGAAPRTATLWGKSPGILAGVPFFDEVFAQCGCTVAWHTREGAHVETHGSGGKVALATVSGPACGLLEGERVALNILARCSGVATVSRRLLVNLRSAGYKGVLAGTRKTTPGFRLVEKYGMCLFFSWGGGRGAGLMRGVCYLGMLVGGADTHRMDLSTMTMLKDNHVWSRGSITKAVKAAKAAGGFSLKIEVEVQSEAEADEAIAAGADIVMLDNFTGDGVKVAARSLRERWAGKREFLIEVSGGLTADNAESYICNGESRSVSFGLGCLGWGWLHDERRFALADSPLFLVVQMSTFCRRARSTRALNTWISLSRSTSTRVRGQRSRAKLRMLAGGQKLRMADRAYKPRRDHVNVHCYCNVPARGDPILS